MNITVSKHAFVKALQTGGYFAGKNKIMPILDCVKIKMKDNSMTIVSSDKDNAISKRLNDVLGDDCQFCVNYKDLSNYVKLASGDSLHMEISEDGLMLTVKHEKGYMEIPLFSVEDFPSIQPDKDSLDVEMDAALLNNWIVYGKDFSANDELRPIFNGLYICHNNGKLECCSTDSTKLFSASLDCQDMEDFNFVISSKVFGAVCESISDSEKVKIKIGGKNITFVCNGVSVMSRVIEGKFPNFKSVIPENNNIVARVNKKDFMAAIARCSLSASQASELIKLTINENMMNLSGVDVDYNRKGSEDLTVDTNGNIEIGFKSSSLATILRNMETSDIYIHMSESSRAAIFTETEHDYEKLFLLMPMILI